MKLAHSSNTKQFASQARTTEKSELIGVSDVQAEFTVDESRLVHARLDGPPVVQAYLAEDKNHVSSPLSEHFVRVLILVLERAP